MHGRNGPAVRLVPWFLLLFLGLTVVLCTTLGPAPLGPGEVLAVLIKHLPFGGFLGHEGVSETHETIVWQLRLPRVILAVLVGAGLASSGVVLQGLLQNPLADPYILGISSGAALGAVLSMLLGAGAFALGIYAVPATAFAGGMATVLIVYRLAWAGGRLSVTALILAGIAVGSLLSAVTSYLMITSGQNVHHIFFWLMGGFAGRNWVHVRVLAPYVIGGLAVMAAFTRSLNVILLGEEPAAYLGINVEKLKLILIASATMVAAASVAVSGVIGFVGLIVPHAVRLVVGPDHRVLLPSAALCGAIFTAAADALARTAASPQEIPVGIITALCGAPFFIYLLRKKRGEAGI